MDSLTWARNALGLRLIAMGAALADASTPARQPEPAARLGGDPIPATSATTLDRSAAVIAERATAGGVWPGRVF